MRVVAWIFNLLLFLVALGFALSNTTVTELRFFLFGDDAHREAPGAGAQREISGKGTSCRRRPVREGPCRA
jgi:hypothetical protein